MTRQNSRPSKKKRQATKKLDVAKHSATTSMVATTISQFAPSLTLKEVIRVRWKHHNSNHSTNHHKPGSIFSSGKCRFGSNGNQSVYTVRIRNAEAAESVLNIPIGTQIRLDGAKIIKPYGNMGCKEISARSFAVVETENIIQASNMPTVSWAIYPTEFGVKQKNGVTLHRPMLLFSTN